MHLKRENHIFFSALKCHCYPEPHQDGGWYPRISKICFHNRNQLRGKNHYLSEGSPHPASTIEILLKYLFLGWDAQKIWSHQKWYRRLPLKFKSVTSAPKEILRVLFVATMKTKIVGDASWPAGHWCRDNVSLWGMERHQFSRRLTPSTTKHPQIHHPQHPLYHSHLCFHQICASSPS